MRNRTQPVMIATNVGLVTASTLRTLRDVDMFPAATFTETRFRKSKISNDFVVKFDRRYGTA